MWKTFSGGMVLKTDCLMGKLDSLWRRGRIMIVALAAAGFTSLAATGWADSLYIITENEDAAIVLDSRQEEAPDIASQLISLSNGSRGYDIMLADDVAVTIHHEGAVMTARSHQESVSTLLNRLHIVPGPLEMVGIDLSGFGVQITVASDLSYYEQVTEKAVYETIRVANPEMLEGTEEVVQEGANGVRSSIYEITWSNGEEISRQFVEEYLGTEV